MTKDELQAAIDCAMYVLRTTDLEGNDFAIKGDVPNLTAGQRLILARGILSPYTSDGQV